MATPAIVDSSAFIEGAEGLVTIFTVVENPDAESRVPRALFPSQADYALAIWLSNQLQRRGQSVGAIDILIASMAINRNLAVVTKDRDFARIQTVEKNLRIEWLD